MKIIEITRPENMKQAVSHLSTAGYEDLRTKPGHDTLNKYSTVLYRPNMSYVVKIFTSQDIAYLSYLKLITSISNPHFPVVRGKPIKVNDEYYGVRLEYLTPLSIYNDDDMRARANSYLKALQRNNTDDIELFAQDIPQTLKSSLDLIYDRCVKGTSFRVDIHGYNAMMRGDTIVIIDPMCPPKGFVKYNY
jgi:hypothetical protein